MGRGGLCKDQQIIRQKRLGSLSRKLLAEPIPTIMIQEAWEAGNVEKHDPEPPLRH